MQLLPAVGTILITGSAGIGKSATIADHCQSNTKALPVELLQTHKSLRGLLVTIANVFGVYTDRVRTQEVYNILTYRAEDCAERGEYIIIDEIQNAGADGIRSLLGLHEQTGMQMVLVGNEAAIKRTSANSAIYDQIDSRLGIRLALARPLPEDIQSIGIEYGVEGADAYRALLAFESKSDIRRTVRLLQDARKLVGEMGPIRLPDLRDAATFRNLDVGDTLKLLSGH